MDRVSGGHCNQYGHVPGCAKGGAAAGSAQAAVVTVRRMASSVRQKAMGARCKEELRRKMPGGKIGQLFSTEEVLLMPVSARVAEAVKEATGKDVAGRFHAITEDRIWHAMDSHSDDSRREDQKDQQDLQWADFEKLPDIFDNYDKLNVVKKQNGALMLKYEKAYDDAIYIALQRIGRSKRKGTSTLNFVTEWVQKNGRGVVDFTRPSPGMRPASPDGGIEAERAADVKRNFSMVNGQLSMVDEVSAAGYTAAVDRFRRLEAVPASVWEELEPGARAGKFFVAAVEDERLLEALRGLIDECLEEGCSEAEFVHRASGLLGELVDPETGRPYYDPEWRQSLPYEQRIAYDRDVSNLDSAARLKLIFRTQWELGAGFAEWQKATEPKRLQRFPGWRFVRQPGAKTKRPDHVEHEGDVRLISDIDYWLARNRPEIGGFNQPHGPWGFNSWMRVEPVSRAECERLGLLAPGEVVEMPPAAAQWDLQHAIDEGNTASMDGLSPEGQERVKERCREAGLDLIEHREDRQPPAAKDESTPLPVGDELERELLELIDELADWQDEWEKLMGSTIEAEHCNQYRHVPGCPHVGEGRGALLAAGFSEAALDRMGGLPRLQAPATIADAKKQAAEAIAAQVGTVCKNRFNSMRAEITKRTKGKVFYGECVNKTKKELVEAGLCDAEAAVKIHYAAGAQIARFFEDAPRYIEAEVREGNPNKERVFHFYCPFLADGIGRPLVADVRVIKYHDRKEPTLYTLSLTIRAT